MVANPQLRKAQLAQSGFPCLDLCEAFGGDFGSVGQAGSQARRGRQIRRGQTGGPGQLTDLRLAEAGVQQGSEDIPFGGGTVAGSMVTAIVEIDPVGQCVEAELLAQGLHPLEELALAVIAAIAGVLAIVVSAHLVGLDEAVGQAAVGDHRLGGLPMVLGVRG